MANPDDLREIGKGVESWNRYVARKRSGSPWRIDLNGADLNGLFLRGADLRGANCIFTNFRGATLSQADLREANLCRANLHDATIRKANLRGASLREADLTGADLTGANIARAELSWATLSWAILDSADLRGALFTTEEQSGQGKGSFLDLGSCYGIETADFDSAQFLSEYLERAFHFAQRRDTKDVKRWSVFVDKALEKINALRALQLDRAEPAPALTEALGVLTAQLLEYLKRHPKQLYEIPPRVFEEIVAEVLASFGWQVDLTPKSKDGGYDIFALSPNGKADVTTSWIIECKRYAPDRKVGVEIVRALYGSNVFRVRDAAMKMLATTSHFTKGVHEMKTSTYDLALKDYEGILDWLNTYKPNPNGKLYLKDNRLVVPGEE